METIEELAKEIEAIKARNKRVEAEKAWETSWFRVFTISVLTYVVSAAVLCLLGNTDFLFNALIPTIGFFLSNQSLPFIKKWWLERHGS